MPARREIASWLEEVNNTVESSRHIRERVEKSIDEAEVRSETDNVPTEEKISKQDLNAAESTSPTEPRGDWILLDKSDSDIDATEGSYSETENASDQVRAEQEWLDSVIPKEIPTDTKYHSSNETNDEPSLKLLAPGSEEDNVQREREIMQEKIPMHWIQNDRHVPRFNSHVTGNFQGEVYSKPKQKHSLDYDDLWVEMLPFARNRKLSSLGIVVDERFITVGEINLLEDPRLGKYRCRPTPLRRSWIWPI